MQPLSPTPFEGMGSLASIAIAFLGGVLSSATPCVLAALPAACAVSSAAPFRRRVSIGLAFTLGTTVSLTCLGMASVYLGRSLQLGMRNTTLAFGVLLALSGLLATGWVRMGKIDACAIVRRGTTVPSAFMFGFLFGTVMTPCATPMLVAILAFLATGAGPVLGAAIMLAYSLGHCVLIFAAGLSWAAVQEFMQRFSAGFTVARKAVGIFMLIAGILLVQSAM